MERADLPKRRTFYVAYTYRDYRGLHSAAMDVSMQGPLDIDAIQSMQSAIAANLYVDAEYVIITFFAELEM